MRQLLTLVLVRVALSVLIAGPSFLLAAPGVVDAAVLQHDAAGYIYDVELNDAQPAVGHQHASIGEGVTRFPGLTLSVKTPGHVSDLSVDCVAPRTTSGLADDVLGLGDDALERLTASQRRSVRSLQTNIAEHEAKLTAYINNPDAYDNLGYLANVPSDAVRQSIIQGRVRHLEGELSTFADQIRKLTGGG